MVIEPVEEFSDVVYLDICQLRQFLDHRGRRCFRHPALLELALELGMFVLLEAFDRLEVAEFSARSLILGRSVGDMRPIAEPQVEALRRKFFPS